VALLRDADAACRAARQEIGAGGVEQAERLLAAARAALAQVTVAPTGFVIKDLQMYLDEAEEELASLRVARVGEALVAEARAAFAKQDLEAAACALTKARFTLEARDQQKMHVLGIEALSACDSLQSHLNEAARQRQVAQEEAAQHVLAGDSALREAQRVWREVGDAKAADALFQEASALYRKALHFDKQDVAKQAGPST
jgi:hypothetical protein